MQGIENGKQTLVEQNRSFAHAIAAEVIVKLPRDVDRDDVKAAAELGLVEAAASFDPARGVNFRTFAYYRIRGAIYDCLRKMGWLPQAMYRRIKFEQAANNYMEDQASVAQKNGLSAPQAEYASIRQTAGGIVACYLLSLESLGGELVEQSGSPEDSAGKEERSRQLRSALERLPEKNRRVLEDHYFREMSLDEIGRNLGLSRSWVCRLHAKGVDMLRELMNQPAPAARRPIRAAISYGAVR